MTRSSNVPEYEIYAIKYGERVGTRGTTFMGGDPHDAPLPMDYYVWALKSSERTFVVDVGFGREEGVRSLQPSRSTAGFVPGQDLPLVLRGVVTAAPVATPVHEAAAKHLDPALAHHGSRHDEHVRQRRHVVPAVLVAFVPRAGGFPEHEVAASTHGSIVCMPFTVV